MLFRENVQADERLALLLNPSELPLQPESEVLQPIGQIEIALPHALNRLVIAGAVPIIVFAEREEPLEIVALAIEAQHRRESRCSAIAIQEWVNVDELKLRDSGDKDGMHVLL